MNSTRLINRPQSRHEHSRTPRRQEAHVIVVRRLKGLILFHQDSREIISFLKDSYVSFSSAMFYKKRKKNRLIE